MEGKFYVPEGTCDPPVRHVHFIVKAYCEGMALKTPVQRSNCVIMSSSRTCEVSSKSLLYVSRRWTLILFRIVASVELQRVSSAQNAAKPTAKHALKGDTVGLERNIMKYSSSRGQLQIHSRYLSLSTMQTKKVILFGTQLNSIYSLPFVLFMCREKTTVDWDSRSAFSANQPSWVAGEGHCCCFRWSKFCCDTADRKWQKPMLSAATLLV